MQLWTKGFTIACNWTIRGREYGYLDMGLNTLRLLPPRVGIEDIGEINVKITESAREEDVFSIQFGCSDTASARRDHKEDKLSAPITAKLAANMLACAGCNHIITMELHASQIQRFLDTPVNNLFSEALMITYNCPLLRVADLADKLGVEFAVVRGRRDRKSKNTSERMRLLVGDVLDKVASLVDGMIDTGHTLTLGARTLHDKGAKAIFVLMLRATMESRLCVFGYAMGSDIFQRQHGGRSTTTIIEPFREVLVDVLR
ncbi:phosphoribosyltransferase-like protein [Pisolithus croceorrhizus]|nr:phosphoribosyltransferase-like protein [Pisolithus croceorrhizus]